MWRFRTQNTLWANYMWNKYCKKQRPTLAQWKGGTQLWKFMLLNREYLEEHIWWEPKGETVSIWYDNWTRLGPLYHLQPQHSYYPIIGVDIFMTDEGWDYEEMKYCLSDEAVQHVKIHLDQVKQTNAIDKSWWTVTGSGQFSFKTTWELLRRKNAISEWYKKIWIVGLPFKISFFGRRVWTNKIPVAAIMANWNPNLSLLCNCYNFPERETVEHLFIKGEVANIVWKYFSQAVGIIVPRIHVKQTMKRWWDCQGNTRQKMIF